MGSRDLQSALAGAEDESTRKSSIHDWFSSRIEQIHSQVSAHDILRYNRVDLKYSGSDREEQISCPFHGADTDPSARVYPSNGRSPSGLWCFVCNERWDVIELWKKFSGEEDTKFTNVLFQIERAFGLVAPDTPLESMGSSKKAPTEDTRAKDEVLSLLQLCETRLKLSREKFQMRNFLFVGQALDRLHFQVSSKVISHEIAKQILRQVLDKIGEKERIS